MEKILAKEVYLPVNVLANQLFTYDYTDLWLGKISENIFLTRMIDEFKWPINVVTMKRCIRNNFYPISGVWKIYERLGQRYTTILASVNAREWVSYLEKRYCYRTLFKNRIHYSYDTGYTKKDKAFYSFIVKSYNVPVTNILMIDDSTNNLRTAQEVGIIGIKFLSATQLLCALQHLEILE